MKLLVKNENGITLILLKTERATLIETPSFKETLVDLIENQNARKIVVDFTGVVFADSTFLSALVMGLKLITEKKGDLKVSGLEPPLRVMFELTALHKVIEVFDNQLEAVESY
jgi:anti-sigma B factor antagonist